MGGVSVSRVPVPVTVVSPLVMTSPEVFMSFAWEMSTALPVEVTARSLARMREPVSVMETSPDAPVGISTVFVTSPVSGLWKVSRSVPSRPPENSMAIVPWSVGPIQERIFAPSAGAFSSTVFFTAPLVAA